MAFSITVKNTFLVLESSSSERPSRRSSSLPRTFKPGELSDSCCDNFHSARGDDSTWSSVSHWDAIDNFPTSDCDSQDCTEDFQEDLPDYPDYRTDCSDDDRDFKHMCTTNEVCLFEDPEATGKIGSSLSDLVVSYQDDKCKSELSLCNMVQHDKCQAMQNKTTLSLDDMVKQTRMKLRSQARPFKSVTEAPDETKAVIEFAVEVLKSLPDILDVHVRDGGMGGTTVIMGKSASADPDPSSAFALVKDALLHSAEQSENTYILGYSAQPFTNIDALSFSTTIAVAPAAEHSTTCWDTYSQGFCPRCATCRWKHPSQIDKMRVIVMIQKGA